MKPYLSIITLGVNNLEAARFFYQEGLKLPLSSESNEHIAFFNLTGTWLALFSKEALKEDALQTDVATGFSGITLAHNVKSEQEVDEVLNEVLIAGGEIVKPAGKTFWGGYSGYFSDLDGYIWEIAHNPFFWIGPKE